MIAFDKEQRVIVTGASSGIGEGIALLLNKLGASVIGIGRSRERLEAMKAKCARPENAFLELKDLTDDIGGLPEYVKSLKEKYGKFHGLALCAGIAALKPLQLLPLEETKRRFDINYFSPLFLAKGFADRRVNNGKGSSIVAISSAAAARGDKGMAAYAGSKAALSASMKSTSRELAVGGVRVNVLSPSDIKTPMTMNEDLTDLRKDREALYPLGFGEVEDVACFAAYLLSDRAKWLTSQNYTVDCGCGVI
ncbi:MAG: SDR family oxidoreductase [Synergistaceae bacterium]|nr:SDR family oxidoreductase [Synergistaceae bacterium]